MRLTDKHIDCIKDFIVTGNQTESYSKFFGRGNYNSDKVNANKFFKKVEVQKRLKEFEEVRDKASLKAIEKVYEKLTTDHVASELELDMLHTKIARRQFEIEENTPIKEKQLVKVGRKTQIVEVVVFKKSYRRPNASEVQRSINALYLRKGSLKQLKVDTNQDDQQAAEASKGNQQAERFFVLSDGSKIPMAE